MEVFEFGKLEKNLASGSFGVIETVLPFDNTMQNS